ncbi:alpha/beta fold hydrolase [Pseudonocardiaceae bacterium YIM PH 21723]|nr:alpha/beta fold hydrolase [Pseudonocardiaceae bacterium YIM PH 21723]
MMSVIEMTTFTVRPGRTQAMLDARPAMVAAFRQDRRGFVSARLIRVGDDTWLDLVEWIDDSAWDESKAKGANLPAIAAFFDTIEELIGAERGVRYDDAQDGSRAVRTIAYGPEPAQVGELYLPEGDGPFPVVVLIHGGYWTAMWDRRQVTALADDLVRRGYAVWNVEYRRVGDPGGGWPGTFDDISAAIDAVDGLDAALDTGDVTLVGHSAGGHLAAWAAHRDAPKITPVAVVTLAAALDLEAADATGFGSVLTDPDAEPPKDAPEPSRPEAWRAIASAAGGGIVALLLGGHRAERPERYRRASPLELPGTGIPVLAVHGTADEAVPAEWSRRYVEKLTANGGDARYAEVDGATHFDLVNPAHSGWRTVIDWLSRRR